MITPLELEKLEFEKHMGGYKRTSVDDWFTVIKGDYEAIYKENIALKDKISVLEELIAKYKAMEDTMQSSILLAQQTGENAISAAKQEADLIISRARQQADAAENDAKQERQKLLEQSEKIKHDLNVFAAKNISLLKSQIEILNQINSDCLNSRVDQEETD
ncbi:MAG: DivIVA domain-containing protein [Clostridia bacterium]|nr:DivIVA domain-containing protein [Clostridia bacterium]